MSYEQPMGEPALPPDVNSNLTKSDAEFYQVYMVEKKAWF